MVHLVSAALPVLVAEGVDGERGDAPRAAASHNRAEGVHAALVADVDGQAAVLGPSRVAVHDDREVAGERGGVDVQGRGGGGGAPRVAPGGTRRVRVHAVGAGRARDVDRGRRRTARDPTAVRGRGPGAPRRGRRATVGARAKDFPTPRPRRARRDVRRDARGYSRTARSSATPAQHPVVPRANKHASPRPRVCPSERSLSSLGNSDGAVMLADDFWRHEV